MTFGPGALVWERFGHNAIWIHDPSRGIDLAYNYGLFDFQQQNFLLRFIRGQMWYWMDGFPAESYFRTYERTNRSVWLQELHLTPAARRELEAFLEWNARPENRYYHYDYYRDNCSTRVRDALDRVLGGAIQAQTAELPTGTTYRDHTLRLTSNDPLVFTGLLAALGPGADRPISAWEEMFIPMKLRDHIRSVQIRGENGVAVPLVKSERVVFQSTAQQPPERPPSWVLHYLVVGLGFGSGLALLGRAGVRRRWARIWFTLLAGGWAFLVGAAGVVLAGMWGFTDHAMTYGNENLLQLNPLAWALLPLLPALARGADRGRSPALIIAVVLAGLSLLGLALKLVPGLHQVNGPIIALALPAHLGVLLGVRRTGRREDGKMAGRREARGAAKQTVFKAPPAYPPSLPQP